jgi:hypothetical protein
MRCDVRSCRLITVLSWALAVILLLSVLSTGAAAQDRPGVHVTPRGYRVPVYGMSVVRDADGRVDVLCARLTDAELAHTPLSRSMSRSMLARSPQVVVQEGENRLAFTVIYGDAPGTGFFDGDVGEQRRAAFEASLATWSAALRGGAPVTVHVRMEEMEEDSQVLAHAGPVDFIEIDGVAVPYALAAQLREEPVGDGGAHIEAVFNSRMAWDYSLDGTTPNEEQTSFLYTALHEVGHGLGFLDTFDFEEGALLNGVPTPYDTFVNRGHGEQGRLTGRSASDVLGDLVSNDLFFAGPAATDASQASIVPLPLVKLHAPDPYEQGSSVSHVDQETYSQVEVGLMTPGAFGASANLIDILTLGILADLGYQVAPPEGAVTTRQR